MSVKMKCSRRVEIARLLSRQQCQLQSKKLVDIGYMHHQRCRIDRRAVRVGLTQRGQNIRDIIARLFARHAQGLIEGNTLEAQSVMDISHILKRVERFWKDQIRYIY